MEKWIYGILLIPLLFLFSPSTLAEDIPKLSGDIYIQDSADLLPKKAKKEITELGTYLDKQIGAQLSVLTIPSLQNTSVNDYAKDVFHEYKLGGEDKQNGVLLLFAVQDRKIYIEVGKGLEETFPPGKIGGILEAYSLPFLEKNNFQVAITNTYNQLFNEIAIKYELDKRASAKGYEYGQGGPSLLTISIFILVFLGIIFLDFKFLGGALCFAVLRILTSPLRRRKIKKKRGRHPAKRVKVRERR
ncbi:hypothetical protein J14TS2_06430 [Bacillus sp. J14TS2]|uniref:TPM domain-containing protein n=1 Tax=Bacillus sp. J14TS2 TaxID=2807188 RepID=UPI001AFF0BF2|nr:TPM domain-containing protein [Bacillus sp. J14TS2]GIN70168.1 hypothetical protein J14TS2_06430 [Bacillus sp. J14TS2]